MHPKSAFKYCPKCGKESLIYNETESNLCCNQCQFLFFINPAAAVAAIILLDDKILFTSRKKDPGAGMLDLPGGFVNIGETAEKAVIREIKEELNLNISSLTYFGCEPNQYPYQGMLYFTLDLAYICTIDSFENIEAMDDVQSFHFIKPEKINLNDIAFSSIKNIIRKYISKKNNLFLTETNI